MSCGDRGGGFVGFVGILLDGGDGVVDGVGDGVVDGVVDRVVDRVTGVPVYSSWVNVEWAERMALEVAWAWAWM